MSASTRSTIRLPFIHRLGLAPVLAIVAIAAAGCAANPTPSDARASGCHTTSGAKIPAAEIVLGLLFVFGAGVSRRGR